MANLVGALLRSLLTDEQLFQWGWRVAFFTGILVAPVAVFLHVYGAEHNPNEGEFNQEEEADGVGFDSSISSSLLRKHPITEALQRDNWAALFSSFLTPMLAGAGNYITFVWMAVFNTTTNIFKFNTLTVDYFKQHQLPNFKSDNETPHERLNKIFQRKISAPMLTEPFPIKCIIPLKVEGVPPQGSVSEFTRRLCRYSELISDMKKTSAANSTFSLLSKALKNELSLCNREDRNKEDKSIIVEAVNHPTLHHTSIIHAYEVFEHLHMLWKGIWVNPFTVMIV